MIGILGGSFNPIHLGHLILAEELFKLCGLEKVIFIPALFPPHKNPRELLSAEHRLNMVKLAVADNHNFEYSDIELLTPGISYSVDTINMLLSANPGSEYALIIGADSLPELHTWERIEELLTRCRIIATNRPGFNFNKGNYTEALAGLASILKDKSLLEKIEFHETTLIDISSTQIRRRCRDRNSVRYLLPVGVAEYIERHQLYRE